MESFDKLKTQKDAIVKRQWKELLDALRRLSEDPHYPSMRGCKTCEAVTKIISEPFGCYFYQARRKESNSP